MRTNSKHIVSIYFQKDGYVQLNSYLKSNTFSKLFVLIDENTKEHCLPILAQELHYSFDTLNIHSGELFKNLDTCNYLWKELAEKEADRQSIVLNLGGGVITDIGGLVASTYKRGIRFINIPTTLLGMVDAAIGGKTGVDFEGLKNQIGLFSNPEMILINPDFLKTLPKREFISGLAEVIKYGLIDDAEIWSYIKMLAVNHFTLEKAIIQKSIAIKERIVLEDPKEKDVRKTLNFGHTLGHAIETHFLSKPKKEQVLHGEAVAIGMILAAHLSQQTQGLAPKTTKSIATTLLKFYSDRLPTIGDSDMLPILKLLIHDKKNINGNVNFILLKAIGKPILDCRVGEKEIQNAFKYYKKLRSQKP